MQDYLRSMRDLPLFADFDASDINAVNSEGENALHVAIHQGNTEIARMLIAEGINVDQPGDLGHTPLHDACNRGNMEIVRLLLESGADVFARDEGETPFSLARLMGHDDICDLLAVEMKKRQEKDPAIRIKARIEQLKREIARLENSLRDAE
ncbi:MAG: ankyrin repeat domain-containing protein [Tepidisphaeraceae bacterium]